MLEKHYRSMKREKTRKKPEALSWNCRHQYELLDLFYNKCMHI